MIVFPNCKINLGLFVTGKRADGFHNIESIFLPLPLKDILEIIPRDDDSLDFCQTGLSLPSAPEENLVVKAYHLLKKKYKVRGAYLHLHKLIPTGAGLGGGSSDAVSALKSLAEIFDLNIEISELKILASELGSDCPFFVENKIALVKGRGEEIQPCHLDLTGTHIVIIKPDVDVITAGAYSKITPAPATFDLNRLQDLPKTEWPHVLRNDFEEMCINTYPVIGEIKSKMYEAGAFYAAMSGSGSAVYGFFDNEPRIDSMKDHFSWSGKFIN